MQEKPKCMGKTACWLLFFLGAILLYILSSGPDSDRILASRSDTLGRLL